MIIYNLFSADIFEVLCHCLLGSRKGI